MAENTPTPPPSTPGPNDPAPAGGAPAPRRRRRWPIIVLAVVVVLLLIVLLLPTIASTGFVRSIVVGKVNDRLNGHITVDDWSLGWFSPTQVAGVRVFDDQNQEIASIAHLKTDLTVLQAIRGHYALGDTVVDEPNLTKLVIDPSGGNNLSKLIKSSGGGGSSSTGSSNSSSSSNSAPSSNSTSSSLPDVSGNIHINNFRAAVVQQHPDGRQDTLFVQPSTIDLKIPDINSPISNDAKLVVKVNDGPEGTISAAGTIAAIANNQMLPVDKVQADQKVGLANVQLAALSPFLASRGIELAGMTNGDLAVKSQGADATVDGAVHIADFAAGGKILNGDTVKSAKIDIPIDISRTGNLLAIKSLKVDSDLLKLDASGQLPLDALTNLQNNKAPGADGAVHYTLAVDNVPALLNELHNTAKLQQGVALTSGKIGSTGDLTLTKDKAAAKAHFEIVDVKGTNNGRAVALSNVTADAASSILPASGIMGGLHDLTVALKSGFASLTGGGPSVAKLDFKGDLDLAKLQQEIGQFIDLGGLQMNGTGTFAMSSNGDVTSNAAPIATNLALDLRNLAIAMPDKTKPGAPMSQVLNQPHVGLAVTGTLDRAADGSPQMLKAATLKLSAGQENQPTVTVDAGADIDLVKKEAPAFTLNRFSVPDLAQVQKEFAPDVKDVSLAGSLTASGAGSYAGKVLTFSQPLKAQLQNVTLVKHTATANATVLNNENFDLAALGKVGLGDVLSADLTTLAVNSSSNLITVQLAQGKPLDVKFSKGAASGSGAVLVKGDLKRLQDVALAFSGSAPAQRLSSGQLDGSIDFARNAANATDIKAALALASVTVPGSLNNESAKVDLAASMPDDVSRLTGSATVSGSFADVKAPKFDVNLKAPLWSMVQSADVTIASNDVSKAYALMNALTPPSTQPAVTTASGQPLPPLEVLGGQLDIAMNVARKDTTTTANVSELKVQNLALRRGQRSYNLTSPVSVKLAAALSTVDDPKLTTAQQLKSLKIEQLGGSLGVADLSMPQPITITDPMANPAAQGSIALSGKIQSATDLLAVLTGTNYPYQGDYTLTQKLSTDANDYIGLNGTVKATGFKVLDEKTGKPTFSEDQLAVADAVTLDTKPRTVNGVTARTLNTININSLSVDMQSSGALKLAAKGIVGREVTKSPTDWIVLQPLQVDLDYDLAKLQPIVKPILAPEPTSAMADLKMSGKHHVTYTVNGSYDTAAAFNVAIRALKAGGALAAADVETNGITVANFYESVALANGVATLTGDPKQMTKVNGGTLDLNGFEVDLASHPTPRLTLPQSALNAARAQTQASGRAAPSTQPAGKPVLAGVQVGPVMAAKALKFLGGLGEGADAGALDLTVTECDKLPLGALMNESVDPKTHEVNDGKATFLFSLSGVKPGGPIFAALNSWSAVNPSWQNEIQGQIRSAKVTIANGVVTQDTTLAVGANNTQVFGFAGGINLQNLTYKDFTVSVPMSFIKVDKNVAQYMPSALPIPLGGSLSKPQLRPEGVLQAALSEAAKKAVTGNLLQGLTGGRNGSTNNGQQQQGQGQQQQPSLENAASDILGGLLNKNNKSSGKDGKSGKKKGSGQQNSGQNQ